MRTATEGIRLVSDAAALWWSRLLPLITTYVIGFALHLLGLRLSVLLGPGHQVLATLVFVLAVLAQVGALVLMLWLCRPPGDEETALDVAALAIGPFLAVYALWGLVDDEVYALFAANIAVNGGAGPDQWSVNLRWWQLYLGLAVGAWLLRQVVAAVTRRSGTVSRRRPWLLLGVVLEGVWTFASALAALALLRQVLGWAASRAVWQGVVGAWYGFVAMVPDLQLPFAFTLPEALQSLVGWLVGTLLPGLAQAVLLPLVWLALAAVVFGWRDVDAHPVADGTVLIARLPGRWATGPWGSLLHRVGLLLTGDLRTKYLPVLRAFRLLWATGPAFLAAYLVLATGVGTLRSWGELSLARLLGPRDPYVALAWSWAEELVIGTVFTTVAVALYAAAARRTMRTGLTGAVAPAATGPDRPTAAPGR
jgi:hypothetical protein